MSFGKSLCHQFRLMMTALYFKDRSWSTLTKCPGHMIQRKASYVKIVSPWWPCFSEVILNIAVMTSISIHLRSNLVQRSTEQFMFLKFSYCYNSIQYFHCEKSARKSKQYSGISAKKHFTKYPLIPFPKLLPQPSLGSNDFGEREKNKNKNKNRNVTLIFIGMKLC